MLRRETPSVAADPDCPVRNQEIRMPERSGKHEMREQEEVRS